MIANTAGLPADFLKSNKIISSPKQSILSLFKSTMSQEGLKGFYRGLDSLFLSKSTTFISNIIIQSYAIEMARSYREEKKNMEVFLTIQGTMFFGGWVSGIISTPFEAVLVRSQTFSHFLDSNRKYDSFSHALDVLKQENNLKVIYKGALGSAFFRSFNSSNYSLVFILNSGKGVGIENMLISCFVACLLSAVVYPVEVLRIKLQTAGTYESSKTYQQVYKEIMQKYGYKGLYSGFTMFCLNKMIFSMVMGNLLL
jgi:hypothetical protein